MNPKTLKSAATLNSHAMRKPTAAPNPDDAPQSPAPASDATALALPQNYEAALEELEKLVQQLEGGHMPLDQLLTGYQRGAQLLKYCRDKLEAVEQQIKVLEGGELQPWVQE